MICPVCNNIAEETVCPVCGYDMSLDREAYPTLEEAAPAQPAKSALLHAYAASAREKIADLEARVSALEKSADDMAELLRLANERMDALSVRAESAVPVPAAQAEEHGGQEADDAPALSEKPILKRGDMLKMGTFQQADIEWLVLGAKDGKALIISRNVLDYRPFSNSWIDWKRGLWSGSALREWLNGTFIRTAFTNEERSCIELTHLPDDDTEDRLFLLSRKDYERYFCPDSADEPAPIELSGQCGPTAHAMRMGIPTDYRGYSTWWLRSPGSLVSYAAVCVDGKGNIIAAGHSVSKYRHGVRPAMVINLQHIAALRH